MGLEYTRTSMPPCTVDRRPNWLWHESGPAVPVQDEQEWGQAGRWERWRDLTEEGFLTRERDGHQSRSWRWLGGEQPISEQPLSDTRNAHNLIRRLCLHLVAATRKSRKVDVATCLASALQGLFFWLGPFVVSLHYTFLCFPKTCKLQERRGGLIGKHSPSGKLPLTWLCVFHRNCRAPSLQLEIVAENSKPACSCWTMQPFMVFERTVSYTWISR